MFSLPGLPLSQWDALCPDRRTTSPAGNGAGGDRSRHQPLAPASGRRRPFPTMPRLSHRLGCALLAGICLVLASPAHSQPTIISFADEDDELIVKLLDPTEQLCPSLPPGESFKLELESLFVEQSQGLIAATLYKLDRLFSFPAARRPLLVRQLAVEEKHFIGALKDFDQLGATAEIILSRQQKSDETARYFLDTADTLYRLRHLCTGENRKLAILQDKATDTTDWSLVAKFGKPRDASRHLLMGLELRQKPGIPVR